MEESKPEGWFKVCLEDNWAGKEDERHQLRVQWSTENLYKYGSKPRSPAGFFVWGGGSRGRCNQITSLGAGRVCSPGFQQR